MADIILMSMYLVEYSRVNFDSTCVLETYFCLVCLTFLAKISEILGFMRTLSGANYRSIRPNQYLS